LSALSIPTQEGELEQKVAARWAILEKVPSGEVLRYALDTDPQLAALREYEFQKVLAAIERARDRGDGDAPVDLRLPEWEMLSRPADAPETDDFRLRTVPLLHVFSDQIAEVVLVERLREVVALTGFTRVEAPDDLDDVGEPTPAAPISREQAKWVPCTEVRGEGLFLRLDTHALDEWERRYKASGRAKQLWNAHLSWRRRRNLPTDHAQGWPGIRYIVLHTLAHALIRELALECGYGASSIRERIYSTRPDAPDMAGVLLYTAAPDSEGTLGGLVSLGEPDHLGRLLSQALERARLCSADPLCSEHDPTTDGSVHHAACHACQFASETSCERGNRFLDRAALVDTFTCAGAALFTGP
jgi:MrfA Zn-binding domain